MDITRECGPPRPLEEGALVVDKLERRASLALDTGLVIFDDSYAFRRLYHMIKHHLDQSRKPKITA